MSNALTHKLAEQWRDALSAYVIHHVLSDQSQAASLNMMTAEHLDRYFLLDTQVTSAVTTSYLAQALATTQTYINAIISNLEPGYDQDLDPAVISFWQQAMSNYSLWAGYQMLEDYPENYIRAEMRLDKTELFKTLENDLSQGKINDANVQNALLTYLKHYEHQNSIRSQSGYIDYRGDHADDAPFDGYTFANSDYYLLGKDAATPTSYYWRKVAVRLDQTSTAIQPDAWTQWQTIAMPAGSTVILARLVLFCGRLHLVWLHHGEPVPEPPVQEREEEPENEFERYTLKLEIMHLGLDNQWSTPETLWTMTTDPIEKGQPLNTAEYRLLALAVARAHGSDDELCVALRGERNTELFSVQRDVLKRKAPEHLAFGAASRARLFDHFEDQGDNLAFQRRITNSKWAIRSVTRAAGFDPFLSLEALLEEQDDAKYHLRLRGRSWEVKTTPKPVAVYVSRILKVADGVWMRAQVRTTPKGNVEFRCMTNKAPQFQVVRLTHPVEGAGVDLLGTAFETNVFGWYEHSGEVEADKLPDALAAYDVQGVREGAGFSVQVGVAEAQVLENASNFITVHALTSMSEEMKFMVGKADAWTGTFLLNGYAATPWVTQGWEPEEGNTEPEITVTLGLATKEEVGTFATTFTLKMGLVANISNATMPYIARQASGTDFLVFENIGAGETREPLVARLNSQHVPDLINRAQASPHAVFDWDAQHLREPAFVKGASSKTYGGWLRTQDDAPMNAYDANGLYLRELFFHVPHLVASRLQEEERYEEARRWLGLIFDPQRKQPSTENPGREYWNCAWIMDDRTSASGLEHQLLDPHTIALHAPSHYRKAIFDQYVHLLIGEADLNYRQPTRDSLANAWLLYRRAADLMGEAPNARTINTWQPKTVSQLLGASRGEQLLACQAQVRAPADLPKRLATFVWTGVAAHEAFRLPVNQHLIDTWQLLEQRFYNLRHYLTIDGQPLLLPLYAPAANPFDLLMARMGGNASLSHLMGYRTVVPPYRFRTIVGKAHEVVTALIQFGEQLRGLMEQEERTELEALQFQQAAEIASYTIGIQEQLYQQQRKSEDVLQAQRTATELRQAHYTKLYEDHISGGEYAAMSLHGIGRTLICAGTGVSGLAHLAEMAPNTFGLANGGMRYKAPMTAIGQGMQAVGGQMTTAAELLRETEGYRRRRQEWQLQAKLAGKELQVLDKQLGAQQHATLAAEQALAHSRKALAHTQQLYAYYQNKSTSVALYRWLRSQVATLQATLFDVAVSLCNSAEACWQFETGQFDKRIIRAPIWQADRYGLNAGNELRLDLHRLESEALLRNERHLEVHKTLSLQALVDKGLVFTRDGAPVEAGTRLSDLLSEHGELDFTLSETLFNEDYPGHYLRRLHSVALSMPALLGPYQNIRATLTQKQSRLLVKPDIEGVKFLTPKATRADEQGDGRNVMMSLRARQQVCLSTANQDTGLVSNPEADDRYRPFEGTGAVSDWHLQFPRHTHQAATLASLSDIIVEVRYFALHGGPLFEEAVEELLEDAAA
ncbi:neuraminidase-like domain-containing protein [Pseudomonas guariconensis]|uniref:Tc toxin subunit A-related protein n=1 Tax=Pseudomonas guariconensis TaxID=1288410 RepID=UPI002B0563B9|nr:neuraminidase-like domain-containing protein [Pseudomonas guariconensis]